MVVRFSVRAHDFPPERPELLCGSPDSFTGYMGPFPWEYICLSVKTSAHFQLVPTLGYMELNLHSPYAFTIMYLMNHMPKWVWFKVILLRECVLWEQTVVQGTEIQTVLVCLFVHIDKLSYIHESLLVQSLSQICRDFSGRQFWGGGGRGVQEPTRGPTKYSTNSSVFVTMEKWE